MSHDPYEQARLPHELKDASLRVVGLTAGCILLLIVAGLALGWGLGAARPVERRLSPEQSFRHGPEDVPDVARSWPALDAQVRLHLETYGWVDRSAGTVRIPIDQAMKRLVENSPHP